MTDRIFELRNYTLHSGQRDVLIELFERAFVESQDAVGAHVIATFRDINAPDHFVWLRGFAGMEARAVALNAFYSGPVWREHRDAANATMIDSDDVYLLHGVGAPLRPPRERPPIGAQAASPHLFVADIHSQDGLTEGEFAARAARDAHVIAAFATEQSPNNFPRLPVRGDAVFVALRQFRNEQDIAPVAGLPAPARRLRLRPTARSLLR